MVQLKKIMHYASGTMGHWIHYAKNDEFMLTGYFNSDWGGSVDTCQSMIRWIFSLGSEAIAWCSKKQLVTALSSTKTEYISTTSAACEAVWLCYLLEDMNEEQVSSTVIRCMSQ